MNDSEKVQAVLLYLDNPRHDARLGYTAALQDIWRILNEENPA